MTRAAWFSLLAGFSCGSALAVVAVPHLTAAPHANTTRPVFMRLAPTAAHSKEAPKQ